MDRQNGLARLRTFVIGAPLYGKPHFIKPVVRTPSRSITTGPVPPGATYDFGMSDAQ